MIRENPLGDLLVHLRIVCDEVGYPLCEARYASIQNYLDTFNIPTQTSKGY